MVTKNLAFVYKPSHNSPRTSNERRSMDVRFVKGALYYKTLE